MEYTDVTAVFLPMATVNSVWNATCHGRYLLALDILPRVQVIAGFRLVLYYGVL